MKDCSGLKTLTIPSTANNLDATACVGVGTKSAPCLLDHPSGFTPQKDTTGSSWFQWKGGYFKEESQPTQHLMGDVNHDGSVTVADVALVTDYALGNIPSVFYVENADMNGDGIITITDVSILVNIVLGGSVK